MPCGDAPRDLAGEGFLTAGGEVQARYEALRTEFLTRATRPDTRPDDRAAGLGGQGVAGLLASAEPRWVIRWYGALRPAWSGWADPQAQALVEAYTFLAGPGPGAAPERTDRGEQEAEHAGSPLRARLH